jgi:hypothetical protein
MAKDDIVEYQFEKGVSGNPKGRPPGIPNAKTRYQRMLGLLEEVKNPVTGEMEKLPLIEVMDLQLFKKARNGDIKAYQEIMNRLEGKAAQSVDVTSGGDKLPTIIIESAYARDPNFRIDNEVAETDKLAKDSNPESS